METELNCTFHHCGIVTSGNVRHIAHCQCPECHDGMAPANITEIVKKWLIT